MANRIQCDNKNCGRVIDVSKAKKIGLGVRDVKVQAGLFNTLTMFSKAEETKDLCDECYNRLLEEFGLNPTEPEINLCSTCEHHPTSCDAEEIEYGKGVGNDNVIECTGYTQESPSLCNSCMTDLEDCEIADKGVRAGKKKMLACACYNRPLTDEQERDIEDESFGDPS